MIRSARSIRLRSVAEALRRRGPEASSAPGTTLMQQIRLALLVFAGYYLGARLGLALTFLPNPISVLWPPNAVLFAALLLRPPREWWLLFGAALPAHLLAEMQGGVPLSMVLCWFLSNSAEALIGAVLVTRFVAAPLSFERLASVAVFVCAAGLAAFLSSFVDSAFVALNRWGQSSYWEVWQTRLFSNVTASLIVVPPIVTFGSGGFAALRLRERGRWIEALALGTGLLATAYVVFDSQVMSFASPALICLPLPFLLWAAARFGPAGVSVAFAVVAALVIWGSGHGLGPFGRGLPTQDTFSVQLFLIFIGPTLLCLAAALAERARSEQALRSSDRRFQLVLQATNDTVYERDLATDRLWWSRNELTQFGYGAGSCPTNGDAWGALLHPDDKGRVDRRRTAAMQSQLQHWDAEFRLRRANGSYAHVHEQGLIVRDAGGRPLQMIGALADVTERRDADELAQRLAHASRLTAMGELTASIAHEINQPMSAILSNVDAAEMLLDAGEVDGEHLRQILDDIRNDDLRASEVIKHIRGLAIKRDATFEHFDINQLIEAVLRLVSPVLLRRRVSLNVEVAPVPKVRGDRIHIQQVLLNLLFNGMDAMESAREDHRLLRVTTSCPEPGKVQVAVRDRGHGIAPEDLGRIFDSFFTTKKNGLGLGLSIARSLVEAQGGRIWAENNPDGGATFRFTLATVKTPAAQGAGRRT